VKVGSKNTNPNTRMQRIAIIPKNIESLDIICKNAPFSLYCYFFTIIPTTARLLFKVGILPPIFS